MPASTLALNLEAPAAAPRQGLGQMVSGLVGSEILKIAAEVRALRQAGATVCDLTVGDFSPAEFRIPAELAEGIHRALAAGQTNYPPSDGLLELRQAVQRLYEQGLGLAYPLAGVLIAGGARPVIYTAYRTLVDPGDTVVYPVPSWNNNHYVHAVGGKGVAVEARPEDGFQPTAAALEPHLRGARLLALCSPLNPAGTGFRASQLREIAELVVAENARRGAGERPLFLLYDHIYWMLASAEAPHQTPVGLVPEVAPYTVFVDGISKSIAATGLRVGWAVGPPYVVARMRDLLTHVGAWAPKAEQVATAELLADPAHVEDLAQVLRSGLIGRLEAFYKGLCALEAAGLPVRSLPPAGTMYLSVQLDLVGRLGSNEAIRRHLLDRAGFAVVPFQAFGLPQDTGWFRLSVGAVGLGEIPSALARLETALREVV